MPLRILLPTDCGASILAVYTAKTVVQCLCAVPKVEITGIVDAHSADGAVGQVGVPIHGNHRFAIAYKRRHQRSISAVTLQ